MNKKLLILISFILLIIPTFVFALDFNDIILNNNTDNSDNVFYQYNTYVNGETNYKAFIDDKANLLTLGEKMDLLEEMKPLTKYGHIGFVSIDSTTTSTSNFAESYYHNNLSYDSGSIFVIDMVNREIYIFSDGANYRVITNSKAYSITDNVYRYATNKNYYLCASNAYKDMFNLLEGRKIAEPMRYTSNVFLALTISFLISFIFVITKSRNKKATPEAIIKNCNIDFKLGDVHADKCGSHRVYSPVSDSGGGSSGGGGGGGGSSGGGGGHSF